MIKEIILHIGYPKTGSTSIQNFLLSVNGLLENFEIFSIHPTGKPNPSGNSQRMLPYEEDLFKIKSFEHWRLSALDKFLKEKLKNNPENRILISAERFVLAQKDDIVKFKNYLSQFTESIKVVCYVRRQDESAVSFFQESLKPGRVMTRLWGTRDFFPKVENSEALDYFNYNNTLSYWENVFGLKNVTLRIFSKDSLIKQDINYDFLEACNINFNLSVEDSIRNFSQKNESLSRLQMLYLMDEKYKYKKFAFSKIENLLCDKKLKPSLDDAKRFYDKYRYSNSMLFQRHGILKEFSDDFNSYPLLSDEPSLYEKDRLAIFDRYVLTEIRKNRINNDILDLLEELPLALVIKYKKVIDLVTLSNPRNVRAQTLLNKVNSKK
ncbi:hypothetical protein AB4256_17680 [Vibrio breoganii]